MAPREPWRTRARHTAGMVVGTPVECATQFLPAPLLERRQTRRLRATVALAYRHVPFYREAMRRRGLTPDDLRTADDLARLPLLEREDLQRDPERFLPDFMRAADCLEQRTGGSSGRPVTIFVHPRALFVVAPFAERRRLVLARLTGRLLPRVTRIGLGPSTSALRPDHGDELVRRSLVPDRVRGRRQSLSMADAPAAVAERIEQFRPHIVAGYGSYLEELFSHLHRRGAPFHRPRAVVFAGDALSPAGRELISRTLGIPVLSFYQTTEVSVVGASCERAGPVHLNTDLVPLRILTAEARAAAPGEQGEVVVSRLEPHGSVVLNYRLGDRAALLPERCPCGRSLPLLSGPEGRRSGWLEGADGRAIHDQLLRSAISPQPHVLRWQAVQGRPGEVTVNLVGTGELDLAAVRARLVPILRERLGPGARVEVVADRPLRRNSAGKAPPVVGV